MKTINVVSPETVKTHTLVILDNKKINIEQKAMCIKQLKRNELFDAA